MRRVSWTNGGFWLMTGLAMGMLISDMTSNSPTVKAESSSSRYEDYCMVPGRSFDGLIDNIWLLDYKLGVLHCLVLNNAGFIVSLGKVDLVEQFELPAGKKIKPHFMMVTGYFKNRNTDFCYLAETESGQILCIQPPLVSGAQRGALLEPTIISRASFR